MEKLKETQAGGGDKIHGKEKMAFEKCMCMLKHSFSVIFSTSHCRCFLWIGYLLFTCPCALQVSAYSCFLSFF